MATVTIGPGGELTLPEDVVRRKGFQPDRRIRVVETRGGVLLVPLDDRAISEELKHELDAWQELANQSWSSFPFEDNEE